MADSLGDGIAHTIPWGTALAAVAIVVGLFVAIEGGLL